MKVIMDACAVIALVKDEPGADVVEAHLLNDDHDCRIHSINLCEVYYGFLRSDGETFTQEIIRRLRQTNVSFRPDLTIDFWQQVGKYKGTIARIALADCFALTLAKQESEILVTSDRREFEPVVNLNICPIEFIR